MSKLDTPRTVKRREVMRLVDLIDTLCDTYGVGSRIPAHRDLMNRFETTERAVLSALAELQRRGRIVRRAGSGTYVASAASAPLRGDALPSYMPSRSSGISNLVVVGPHDHGYYSRGIEMAFEFANQCNLEVTYEPPNFDRLSALARRDGNATFGYLVLVSGNVHDARRLYEESHNIVGVGDWLLADRVPFPCVYPNNLTGGYIAASHLIDSGHERLGYLAAGDNPRLWGHEQAVREAQSAGRDVHSVTVGRDTFEEWQRNPAIAEEFFSNHDRPTGFCTWNDTDAIRLMTFLMSIGLNVPNDISIVGFDNLPVGQSVTPALTTIEIYLDNQVELALDLLLNRHSLPRHSIVVEPELVVRQSTLLRK